MRDGTLARVGRETAASRRPAAAVWQDGRHVGVVLEAGGRGRLRGPVRPAARRPDRRADPDARLHRPRAPRRHRLPRAGHLDRPRRLRRPALRSRRRHGRRADRRARRAGHRLGVPAQLLGADPRRVHRPRQRGRLLPAAQDPRVGRPGRDLVPPRAGPARLRPRQGLGARRRPRRRRDRRAGRVAAPRHQRADRAARRARRPAHRCPVEPLFTAGEPDRMAFATMAILRRNLVPLRVLEPWVARIAAGGPGQVRRARPVPRPGQPRGVPAGALPAAGPRAATTRRTLRPAAGAGRRAEAHQPVLPRRTSRR